MEEIRFFRKMIFVVGLLFGLSVQLRAEPFDLKSRGNIENAYEAVLEVCIYDKLTLLSYDYIPKANREDFKGYIDYETDEEMIIIFTDEDDLAIKTYWRKNNDSKRN